MRTATKSQPVAAYTLHAAPEQPHNTLVSVPQQQNHEDNVTLTGSHPEGLPLEQVPAETRHLLEIALPGEGQRLLAHLLRYATCAPEQTLPTLWLARLPPLSAQPRALIVVRSLKALAQSPGSPCGADRYGHLVLACEALGVLTRRVHRCGTAYATILSVALQPYTLTPAVIQTCHQMEQRYTNPRVQRLLKEVRLRVQATLPQAPASPSIHALLSQMEALVQHYEQHSSSQAPMLHLLYQMMHLILSATPSYEVGTQEQDLSSVCIEEPAGCAGNVVPRSGRGAPAALISSENGGVSSGESMLLSASTQENSFVQPCDTNLQAYPDSFLSGGQDLHRGSRFVSRGSTNPQTKPASQAAALSASRKTSRFLPPDGTNLPEALSINDSFIQRRKEGEKASSLIDKTTSGQAVQVPSTWLEAQSNPMQVQSGTEPRGEEDRERSSAVQIRQEAVRYAYLLDGDTQWLGKLVLCVRQYPAHLRRLACIATLTRLYDPRRSRLERPGAWFAHTCKLLVQGVLQLPEEVYQWAATELDEEQIAAAIQQGYLPPEPEESGPSTWTGTDPLPAAFDIWAEQGAPEQWKHVAAPPSTEPMDQEMAEQLAAKVSRDVASDPFPSQIELLPGRHPGRWRVLLTWKQGVEVPLDTEEEWVSYFSRVQATANHMKRMNYKG